MDAVINEMSQRHQLVAKLMGDRGLSQADVARELDVSRARVSQLLGELRKAVRSAIEEGGLNTSGVLGSGVRGPASGAGPESKKAGE